MSNQKEVFKRKLKGMVVSDASDKTVVVRVERRIKHPMYSKFVTKTKKYHVHDEKNNFKNGDFVTIEETKPYSKNKYFKIYIFEIYFRTKNFLTSKYF